MTHLLRCATRPSGRSPITPLPARPPPRPLRAARVSKRSPKPPTIFTATPPTHRKQEGTDYSVPNSQSQKPRPSHFGGQSCLSHSCPKNRPSKLLLPTHRKQNGDVLRCPQPTTPQTKTTPLRWTVVHVPALHEEPPFQPLSAPTSLHSPPQTPRTAIRTPTVREGRPNPSHNPTKPPTPTKH